MVNIQSLFTIGILLLSTLLFLILVIPFHFCINLSLNTQVLKGRYRIAWLWLTLRSGEITPQSPEIKDAHSDEIDRLSRDKHKSNAMWSLQFQSVMKALPGLVHMGRNILRSLHLEKLSCRMSIGLEDPTDTAVISGYLWSIFSALVLFRGNISIEPYFQGERLEGRIAAELKGRVLSIVFAILSGLKEKEIRRLLVEMFRGFDRV